MKLTCHKCSRITCTCWAYEHRQEVRALVKCGFDYQFRLLVVIGILVSATIGCATKNVRRVIPPPPMPSNESVSMSRNESSRAAVQSAIITSMKIRLDWDKVETNTACMTEVWSSTNATMQPRFLRTNVLGSSVILPMQTQEFFIIRNNLNGEVSEWNTK